MNAAGAFNGMYRGDRLRPPYAGLDAWARAMPVELRSM